MSLFSANSHVPPRTPAGATASTGAARPDGDGEDGPGRPGPVEGPPIHIHRTRRALTRAAPAFSSARAVSHVTWSSGWATASRAPLDSPARAAARLHLLFPLAIEAGDQADGELGALVPIARLSWGAVRVGPMAFEYQVKMSLAGIRPAIWRRVMLPGNLTFARLHRVIQDAMGWDDCHLHEFEVGDLRMDHCPTMPPSQTRSKMRRGTPSSVCSRPRAASPTSTIWGTAGPTSLWSRRSSR